MATNVGAARARVRWIRARRVVPVRVRRPRTRCRRSRRAASGRRQRPIRPRRSRPRSARDTRSARCRCRRIPATDRSLRNRQSRPLGDRDAGERHQVVRVRDRGGAMLAASARSSRVASPPSRALKSVSTTRPSTPRAAHAAWNASRRRRACSMSEVPATWARMRWPRSTRWSTVGDHAVDVVDGHSRERRVDVGVAEGHRGEAERLARARPVRRPRAGRRGRRRRRGAPTASLRYVSASSGPVGTEASTSACPAGDSSRSTPAMNAGKNGSPATISVSRRSTRPSANERFVLSERARRSGDQPISAATARMRSRVATFTPGPIVQRERDEALADAGALSDVGDGRSSTSTRVRFVAHSAALPSKPVY